MLFNPKPARVLEYKPSHQRVVRTSHRSRQALALTFRAHSATAASVWISVRLRLKKKNPTHSFIIRSTVMEKDSTAVIEAMQERDATLAYEEVASRAYAIWEARGRGDGSAEQDWLEAEQQLREMRSLEPRAFQMTSQSA